MAKKQFKAESKRLLDLMINSIYTNREIFLREIISNASDAIDKLVYISLTDDKVELAREDFRIRVTADKSARTITVSDNGIGMTAEELEKNLGVIARSGSREFKAGMDENTKTDADVEIIGQFGVGFYSSFMVADRVTVMTRAYGADTAYKWESVGADGYTVAECEKNDVGTDVIMHIKADCEEENYSSYLEVSVLQSLVRKYSDYVRWPIIMDVQRGEWRDTGETGEDGKPKQEYVTVTEEKTVNSMVPIWQRSKSDATDEDCMAFYREHFHDTEDPVAVIRVNAEGLVSYRALLFIPGRAPYDFYTREYKPGLQLYSNGVMIMDKCSDLIPDCFRFVRGVVESPDLSLNISREMLQHDRQLRVIAGNLEKKIKQELKRLMDSEPEKYNTFWQSFGVQLKYGTVMEMGSKKDMLQDLLMFQSSMGDKPVSLHAYVEKMPESQKFIYFACAENAARASQLPQTELVRKNGFEILYLTADVDEFAISAVGQFEGRDFCNVSVDDLGLETPDDKADTEKKEAEARPLLDFVKQSIGESVSEVKLSHKLVSHPVCLSTEGSITLEMEKYLSALPGNDPGTFKATRVLELNAEHPAFKALEKAYNEDKDKAEKLSKILLAQAELIAGLSLDDVSGYTELVCGLF